MRSMRQTILISGELSPRDLDSGVVLSWLDGIIELSLPPPSQRACGESALSLNFSESALALRGDEAGSAHKRNRISISFFGDSKESELLGV